VSPVKYELGFYIPGDDILHSDRRENRKSYIGTELIRSSRSNQQQQPAEVQAPTKYSYLDINTRQLLLYISSCSQAKRLKPLTGGLYSVEWRVRPAICVNYHWKQLPLRAAQFPGPHSLLLHDPWSPLHDGCGQAG
jgi:hypothetical protein